MRIDRPYKWHVSLQHQTGTIFEEEDIMRIKDTRLREILLESWVNLNTWYHNCDHKKVATPIDIINASIREGPKYTEQCKLEWNYGFRNQFDYNFSNRGYGKSPTYCYRPLESYLPFWVEDSEDYKFLFTPSPKIEQEDLDNFEKHLDRVLPNNFTFKPVSLNITDTKGFDDEYGRNAARWQLYEKYGPGEMCHSLRVKRSLIPVKPGGWRDSVLLGNDSYHTVVNLDQKLQQLVEADPNCYYSSDQELSEYRKKQLHKYGFWYMRDYSKCGLKYPHQLISVIRKVLMRKYPGEDFEYLDCFLNISYWVDEEYRKVTRGYCQGMANALMTLTQLVVFSILRETYPNLRGIHGNDDSVLSLGLNDNPDSLMEDDMEINRRLGLEVSEKKTFISHLGHVFFEQYTFEGYKDKCGMAEVALSSAYWCENKLSAKMYISMVVDNLRTLPNNLLTILDYWSASDEEKILPHLFGGFFTLYRNGLPMLWDWYDSKPEYLEFAIRSFYASTPFFASAKKTDEKVDTKDIYILSKYLKEGVLTLEDRAGSRIYSVNEILTFFKKRKDISDKVRKIYYKELKKTPEIDTLEDFILLVSRNGINSTIPEWFPGEEPDDIIIEPRPKWLNQYLKPTIADTISGWLLKPEYLYSSCTIMGRESPNPYNLIIYDQNCCSRAAYTFAPTKKMIADFTYYRSHGLAPQGGYEQQNFCAFDLCIADEYCHRWWNRAHKFKKMTKIPVLPENEKMQEHSIPEVLINQLKKNLPKYADQDWDINYCVDHAMKEPVDLYQGHPTAIFARGDCFICRLILARSIEVRNAIQHTDSADYTRAFETILTLLGFEKVFWEIRDDLPEDDEGIPDDWM